MSLARTALRVAAVAALNADPVIAALCPGRIYDSRIDELDAKDPVPIIVVYTEDDTGMPWSKNNGGPPFDHECHLLFEISMRVMVPADDEDGEVAIGMAETDAEAEAALDFLEERAVAAVTIADTAEARLIRAAVTRRATELKSIRFASADSGAKLALRIVTLTVHLKIYQPDPLAEPTTGTFAGLPEPLRTVALALPVGSSGYTTCAAVAAMLTPDIPVPLKGIDTIIQPTSAYDPANPPRYDDTSAADPLYDRTTFPCPKTPPASS